MLKINKKSNICNNPALYKIQNPLNDNSLWHQQKRERERGKKTSFINFEREKIDFRIYTFAQFQFSCNFLPPLEIYSYYMLLAQTLCSSFNYIYIYICTDKLSASRLPLPQFSFSSLHFSYNLVVFGFFSLFLSFFLVSSLVFSFQHRSNIAYICFIIFAHSLK